MIPNDYSFPRIRWAMLSLFILLTLVIELQWLTHAPIARVAETFYADQLAMYSWLSIDSLALIYMLIFLVLCLPASYVIDTYGIRIGLGLGAALTILGGAIKGGLGGSLFWVFIGQVLLAIAQPFVLNAVTAFSVRWFPLRERGAVAGLLALAQYLGILTVMLLSPALVNNSLSDPDYGQGVDRMLFLYMIPTVTIGLLVLIFLKEKPADLPYDLQKERLSFRQGLAHMFRLKDALIVMLLFTVGLGIFNAVSSLVDAIAANLQIEDSDGLIGGIMIIGGIIGAIILPILSDYYRKRKLFLVICMAGAVPALFGLAYAQEITQFMQWDEVYTYSLALASSFGLGFFIMSAGPIGFQYTAEITTPTPESTSQGILLLVGQVSGIAAVIVMSMDDNQLLDPLMKVFAFLLLGAFILVVNLKESRVIVQGVSEGGNSNGS